MRQDKKLKWTLMFDVFNKYNIKSKMDIINKRENIKKYKIVNLYNFGLNYYPKI